jgi:hypothetical protein
MGILDMLFAASLTASMTSNSVKNAMEAGKEVSPLSEKAIILSHEKSCLGRLCIERIRKDSFEDYAKNILQITREIMGKNDEKEPLFFMEYLADTDDIEDICIVPNNNCYQKQFKNSRFCALTFNEVEDLTINDQSYKLVKIHTEPIESHEELYICEVVKTS